MKLIMSYPTLFFSTQFFVTDIAEQLKSVEVYLPVQPSSIAPIQCEGFYTFIET